MNNTVTMNDTLTIDAIYEAQEKLRNIGPVLKAIHCIGKPGALEKLKRELEPYLTQRTSSTLPGAGRLFGVDLFESEVLVPTPAMVPAGGDPATWLMKNWWRCKPGIYFEMSDGTIQQMDESWLKDE